MEKISGEDTDENLDQRDRNSGPDRNETRDEGEAHPNGGNKPDILKHNSLLGVRSFMAILNDLDFFQREVSEPDVYGESPGRKSLTVARRHDARDPETRGASDCTADADPMITEHNKTPAAHRCAQQESLALNRSGGFPETRDGKLHCLIQG